MSSERTSSNSWTILVREVIERKFEGLGLWFAVLICRHTLFAISLPHFRCGFDDFFCLVLVFSSAAQPSPPGALLFFLSLFFFHHFIRLFYGSCWLRIAVCGIVLIVHFLVKEVVVQMWDSRSQRTYYKPPLGFEISRPLLATFLSTCRKSFSPHAIDLQLDLLSSGLWYRWFRDVHKIQSDQDLEQYLQIASSSRPPLFLYCKQAPVSASSFSSSVTLFATPPTSPEDEPEQSKTSSRDSSIQNLFHEAVLSRDQNKCLISGKTVGLEAAHVYPLNVGILLLCIQFCIVCDSSFRRRIGLLLLLPLKRNVENFTWDSMTCVMESVKWGISLVVWCRTFLHRAKHASATYRGGSSVAFSQSCRCSLTGAWSSSVHCQISRATQLSAWSSSRNPARVLSGAEGSSTFRLRGKTLLLQKLRRNIQTSWQTENTC